MLDLPTFQEMQTIQILCDLNILATKLNLKQQNKTQPSGRQNKTHNTSVGWIQPEGCQFATSAEIQLDEIHDSALIYQPSHPIKGRNEVRYGLDYQCFLRKDSPLNHEFDSGFQGLLAQGWGEPNSLPFTQHFFVPRRCQGGCSPWGSGWSSEP